MTALPDCWPDCLTDEQRVWAALLGIPLTDPVLIAWHDDLLTAQRSGLDTTDHRTYEEAVDHAIRVRDAPLARSITVQRLVEDLIALPVINPRSFLVGTI